jgi:hypothetical protein
MSCFERWHSCVHLWVTTHSSVDCHRTKPEVSLYSRNRKQLFCEFVKCNIIHAIRIKYGVGALKIHRNIITYITQNNFWIYENVSWVRFSAKHRYFRYKCRTLFCFKQFFFMIVWHTERIIYLFFWRPAMLIFKCPKIPATRGRLAFKTPYVKG